MSTSNRLSVAGSRSFVPRSLDARIQLIPRAAAGIAALVLTLAIAGQLVAASRLHDVRRTAVTAQEVERGLAAAASTQVVVVCLLVLAGLLALGALHVIGRAATRSLDNTIDGLTGCVEALIAGQPVAALSDADAGAAGRLHDALRRLGRQMHTNSEAVHALAAGAFRRAAMTRVPDDAMGQSLMRLTRTMEEMATAAHRIARGDISVRIAPQSPDDAFGEAYAAMIRRVKNVLREVEETRDGLAVTISHMRTDADALAATTSHEADSLRRTLDQLSYVALQAEADVARGSEMMERCSAGEAMIAQSATSLEESVCALKELVRRSSEAQRLARDAGLLVIRAAGAGDAAADAARTLAAEASATSGTVSRLMIEGSERAHQSRVSVDRAALAARDGLTIARQLDTGARARAVRLREMDGSLARAQGTATDAAVAARQLAGRMDTLTGHVRRLEGVMRRFGRSEAAIALVAPLEPSRTISTSYPTPPHASVAFPRLALARM